MKKYLAVLLLILVWSSPCYAWWNLASGAGKVAVVGCTHKNDYHETTPTSATNIGASATLVYVAQQFTAGTEVDVSYDACKVSLNLQKNGTGQSVTVHIYGDDGSDDPDTSLGSCGTIAAAAISDDAYSWYDFTCSTPISLTNGTKYWIVAIAGGYDLTNYIEWGRVSVAGIIDSDADGLDAWTNVTTNRFSNYRIYGP